MKKPSSFLGSWYMVPFITIVATILIVWLHYLATREGIFTDYGIEPYEAFPSHEKKVVGFTTLGHKDKPQGDTQKNDHASSIPDPD